MPTIIIAECRRGAPQNMSREELLVAMVASRRAHRHGIRHLVYKWWLDAKYPLDGKEVRK